MLNLLCITAHPDDEAAGFGGTLLRYHDAGVETHVVCLTPGQAARHRGGAASDVELSEIRRGEFAASCAVLQVTSGEVLHYRDGELLRTNFFDAVGDLVGIVRRIRPHVLLTFGPEGGLTGHPDHATAGLLATAAFQWAAHSNRFPEQLNRLGTHRAQKLYYATADFLLEGRQPIAPPPVTAVIDIAPYRERKLRAFRQHNSQAPLFELFEKNIARHSEQELFHLAAAITPRNMKMETDLFEGVTE